MGCIEGVVGFQLSAQMHMQAFTNCHTLSIQSIFHFCYSGGAAIAIKAELTVIILANTHIKNGKDRMSTEIYVLKGSHHRICQEFGQDREHIFYKCF